MTQEKDFENSLLDEEEQRTEEHSGEKETNWNCIEDIFILVTVVSVTLFVLFKKGIL